MTAQLGSALLVGVGFIGMVVLFVALIFIRNPTRFRRMVVGGLVMVVGSMVLWWWLISTTFAERMG